MSNITPLHENEIIYLKGNEGTIAVVKAGSDPQYFLETNDEELVLGLDSEDIIVGSSFSIGEIAEKGLKCILFSIRELKSPLIVLPKDHPASKRLKIAVSAGTNVILSCDIVPGTHPEQNILCSKKEFMGGEIKGVKGGIEINNLKDFTFKRCNFDI